MVGNVRVISRLKLICRADTRNKENEKRRIVNGECTHEHLSAIRFSFSFPARLRAVVEKKRR